jgi:RNA polymerase sigma-70 factor (ECF subfamily)
MTGKMQAPMAIASRGDFVAIVGDEAKFRDWYDATLPRVYRYLVARCAGDDALAEELTQQTFVEAIRQRHRFDGRSDVVTWMCAIGRNKLVDHFRRQGREVRRQERLIAGNQEAPDSFWRAAETREAVESALSELPHDQRLALLFRYLDGMSVREVAHTLGRGEKATESLLARGRESFRRAFGGRTDA